MKSYRTIDLARAAGIHVNTVRFYQRIGFLSPVPRAHNGYRVFSERHLYQLKVCRDIYGHGWLGHELRQMSREIIEAMVRWDLPVAVDSARQYLAGIEQQHQRAQETADILARWTKRHTPTISKTLHTHRQTAMLLGVTEEVLRNWERNGLIDVPRVGSNHARRYGAYEIERLHIIYLLRQANYSIAAIRASLHQYDAGNSAGAIAALHTPEHPEDVSWLAVGDRLMASLDRAADGARHILALLQEIADNHDENTITD